MEWAMGNRVVLMRLDTGGGKTVCLSFLVNGHNGFSCVIAHRDKLVEQLSLTLARNGIRHDIIASEKTKRLIAKKHVKKLGQCFYMPGARCRVASIDTLTRAKGLEQWAAQVTLWIVDEGHHLVKDNKWAKGVGLFTNPNCLGLLPTATPKRADGKGLGSHHDGFADVMVEGPPMRWLIEEGYLCDYKVVCPPTDMVIVGEPGPSGDYTTAQHREAARNSHIVGDIPAHYLKFAAGMSGITFLGDVETAKEVLAAYRAAGVRAELITGDTDVDIRDRIFERLENGGIDQVLAIDVVSEGVDIPALQVGSFGRLTQSLAVWMQQIGRLLRPIYAPGYDLETREGRLAAIAASKKPFALLIDHTHGFANPGLGPPDKPRDWMLDRRDKRAKSKANDDIPLRICANPHEDCFTPYPRIFRTCPSCRFAPEPQGRSSPETVDGDLQLLDDATLARLRGMVVDVDKTRDAFVAEQLAKGARSAWVNGHFAAFQATTGAQRELRDAMDLWAGRLHAEGRADYEIHRAFFHSFGCDVLTAQSLEAKAASALKERIDDAVNRPYIPA
jgi:DNA repair protein RadD